MACQLPCDEVGLGYARRFRGGIRRLELQCTLPCEREAAIGYLASDARPPLRFTLPHPQVLGGSDNDGPHSSAWADHRYRLCVVKIGSTRKISHLQTTVRCRGNPHVLELTLDLIVGTTVADCTPQRKRDADDRSAVEGPGGHKAKYGCEHFHAFLVLVHYALHPERVRLYFIIATEKAPRTVWPPLAEQRLRPPTKHSRHCFDEISISTLQIAPTHRTGFIHLPPNFRLRSRVFSSNSLRKAGTPFWTQWPGQAQR